MLADTYDTVNFAINGGFESFPGLQPLKDYMHNNSPADLDVTAAFSTTSTGTGESRRNLQTSFGNVFNFAMFTLGDNYSFENVTVDTNDGYELTLFTITGDSSGNPVANQGTKGPVLLMHGLTLDSLAWFNKADPSAKALATQLTDAGYQVYFGNIRGSPNSRSFSSGADATSNERAYWDFSVDEMGKQDVPAMVKAAYQDYNTRFSSCKKVQIVGHSLATTQMLISFSTSSGAADYVSNGVMLAPCPIPSTNDILQGASYSTINYLITQSNRKRVYSLFGPNWTQQKNDVYCKDCGRSFWCRLFNPLSTQCSTFDPI